MCGGESKFMHVDMTVCVRTRVWMLECVSAQVYLCAYTGVGGGRKSACACVCVCVSVCNAWACECAGV